MALIKCPECGREKVSDTAEACPDCGYGIKAYFIEKREEERKRLENEEQERIKEEVRQRRIKEENLKKEKANKKKELAKKIVKKSLPIIIILVITIIGLCLYLVKIGKKEYRDAISYFETGDYEYAMRIFESLDNYRDSNEYIEKCKVNIALDKYNDENYILAYNKLILLSPETFERVMNDATISLGDMLYDCRKNCADLGHLAFTNKSYSEAASYFEICYEYNSISYEDEYLFSKNLLAMKTFWYYFKPGQEIHDGFFYIKDGNISSLGIDSLGVEKGYYDYEVKDGVIYIPDLEVYIYPPKSEDAGNLTVKKGSSSYTFYDNQNYMKNEAIKKAKNEPKDPAIGMTAEEVKASTWGLPKEINKTTYAWGITEQWVYSGYRYIYFDNGKVTAISE